MSDETPRPDDAAAGGQLRLLLGVLTALVLGFLAGRLSGGAAADPAHIQAARLPPADGSAVVARVGGQVLTLEQFRARWEALSPDTQRFHRQRGGPEDFLDEIAEEFLLSEEAMARGLAEETMAREWIRREVNRGIVRPLLTEEVQAKAIPEAEVKARFELRRSEWEQPARARVRELRVTPEAAPPGIDARDDAKSPEEAEAKVRRLHERLKAGEDFAELAEAFSEAASGRYGGLIGWVVEGRLALEYEEAALGLAAGRLSEPLPLQDGGWVLLLCEERQEAGTVAYEEYRDEVLQDLLAEDPGAVSRRYRVFVEELKRSHDYRVFPEQVREAFGGADSGQAKG